MTRSNDHGRTWSAPRAIEPGWVPNPSWASTFQTPSGRLYVVYTIYLHGRGGSRAIPCFRYSDDRGLRWNDGGRYRLPVRATGLDAADRPVAVYPVIPKRVGDAMIMPVVKQWTTGPNEERRCELWLVRSRNILHEDDPSAVDWEWLPRGDEGIHGPGFGPYQHEHDLVGMHNGNLYCVFRTHAGVMGSCILTPEGQVVSPPAPLAGALRPRRPGLVEIAPPAMLARVTPANEDRVSSGFNLSSRRTSAVGRVALSGGAAFVLALAVAIPTTLYLQYAFGGLRTSDVWTCERVPAAPYENDVTTRLRLQEQGVLAPSGADRQGVVQSVVTGWECVGAAGLTAALVLLFTVVRRRCPWWPLHPLLFLVMGTNDAVTFSASFLIGWGVKAVALRYGGGQVYRRIRPLIIGFIAGAMLAGLLTAVIGAAYYAATGRPPIRYRVF